MVAGILKPDKGSITVDDMEVYDNETAKELFFYISDDCYFPTSFTPARDWRLFTGFIIRSLRSSVFPN